MIVADTDVLIDALRGEAAVAGLIAKLLRERRLATTAITRLELGVGASTAQEKASVDQLLAAIPVLALDAESAGLAAEVGASLRTAGQSVPFADLAIAGICLRLGAELLTRNRRHFERVEGLALTAPPAGG